MDWQVTPTATFAFTLWVEQILQELALILKVCLELVAILIIAIAVGQSLPTLFQNHRRRHPITQQSVRLELGLSLALSLEFLLAADIVGTAVSPKWSAIAKLAAITGIRTFLNFFLQREVKELQQSSQPTFRQPTDSFSNQE